MAVKHAKRLGKRMNRKPSEDSDSDEDDLVRMIDQSVFTKLLKRMRSCSSSYVIISSIICFNVTADSKVI